ncbi:protein ALP1-like [Senna tora]|uniref:Protein ALP1-like n=1 Tax=Senna tora TaxID=362788 RepID=A0A834WEZ5_9FABA|nr:protein ALP1-like [Senna tora]
MGTRPSCPIRRLSSVTVPSPSKPGYPLSPSFLYTRMNSASKKLNATFRTCNNRKSLCFLKKIPCPAQYPSDPKPKVEAIDWNMTPVDCCTTLARENQRTNSRLVERSKKYCTCSSDGECVKEVNDKKVSILAFMEHISDEELAQIRISPKSYTYDSYAGRARLRALVYASDTTCFNQIRMYRHTFDRLCGMLDRIGGLRPKKNMLVDEQVAIFLHILSHHVKNRVVQFEFERSGETGCLGAIDGTHIKTRVPAEEQGKYRNRKGEITTNVLGVCSRDGQFVYVLSGWEGSTADGRVLKDAIERDDGLKIPRGQYYLVDAGFSNCRGFFPHIEDKDTI